MDELIEAFAAGLDNMIKHCRGKITNVSEGSKYADVDVNGKSMRFPNKTASELTAGEEVEIRYWTNISNGWIAMKTGGWSDEN